MNRFVILSAVVLATLASAQEIGSEIPPPPTPQYDNPYGPAKKDGEVTPPPAPPPAGVNLGGQLSAGKGAFGFRASLGGSATALPTATAGFAIFATDIVKLTFDAGMSVAFTSSNTPFGFGVAFGIEPVFRTTAASARPFIVAQVGFGKTTSAIGDDFALLVNLGGGGEYFFSPGFSMNVRAVVAMPVNLKSGTVGFVVFTPGVGATVYL